MIEAYALTVAFLEPGFYVAANPVSAVNFPTWESCIDFAHGFDPGLNDVHSAFVWCVERDSAGKVVRVERIVQK
jgi:hypothetical protein